MPQTTSERHTSPPSPSCRQRAEIFCYMEYISSTVGYVFIILITIFA